MLVSTFVICLLTASSVAADARDDLEAAFNDLGLGIWGTILGAVAGTAVDEIIDLLTGVSGRTFLVPKYAVSLCSPFCLF